ncbi:ABC transporter ATP-binding protein [Streptacidiphilus monticola]|uniref:ABC transporter ATP-binding protein n=1 Tax=Streptacidiphilus monticola TaxID=2161674 RepID=A0ABW1FXA4_9ACTN
MTTQVVHQAPTEETAAVDVEELDKTYGRNVGVTGLTVRIERGEVFGFLGPNGAGKTTTLRCLVGLLRPTGGRLRVLGLDPVSQHRALAPRIGYLPGELRLYPELTGTETLRLLGDLQGAPTPRRAELCERLSLSASDLARPVREYSRGMKQKIGLVQAFQHEPELVILDEPTEGLDPLVQETFFALLDETARAGRTVLLSSHVLPEVQRACRRVAIIGAGRLVTVQAVAALREARARRVRLVLADRGGARPLGAADQWSPSWRGDEVTLLVPPDQLVGALRELLAALPVADLCVEEAGLDEAFLDLYRAGDAGHGQPAEVQR